jgi:acetyltransferase-like isoleucine patch superfamily enzyme
MDGLVKFRVLVNKVLFSEMPIVDFLSIFFSLIFCPRNFFISYKVLYSNKGILTADGYSFFGIKSNRVGLNLNSRGCLRISNGGELNLGKNVRIALGGKFFINEKCIIGENTYIQPNANILVNTGLKIGSDCAISWNVQIIDDDMHTVIKDGIELNPRKKIFIGDHVWIGTNVTILKGSIIGSNSIIAAGSVVSGEFPDNSLVGGIPAKIIHKNVNWK